MSLYSSKNENSTNIYEELKRKVDLKKYIESVTGKNFKKRGSGYRLTPCPMCNGGNENAAFSVSEREPQLFYCFSCDQGGDVFHFVEKYFKCTKEESLKKIENCVRPKNIPKPKFLNVWEQYSTPIPKEELANWLTQKRGFPSDVAKKVTTFNCFKLNKYKEERWLIAPCYRNRELCGGLKINLLSNEKKNLSDSRFTNGAHLFFDTNSTKITFVESVTNALCLAAIGYSSVCLFGKSGATHIDKIVPQIRKGKHYLWLDQDGTKAQQEALNKFSFLLGVEFDKEDNNEKGNFDVNDLLRKYPHKFSDKVKYYIEKAKPGERKWHKGQVVEKDSKTYIVKESRKRELFPFEVANFTLRILNKIYDDEQRVLWRVLLSKEGEKKTTLELEGSELTLGHKLRDKIGSRGLFLVNDTRIETHNALVQWAFNNSTITERKKTQYLGRAKGKNFVFCNAVAVPGKKEKLVDLIPPDGKMKLTVPNDLREFWRETTQTFLDVYGSEAWKALGFSVASIFSKEIRESYNFPLLFLNGPKGSGKSELFGLILRFFGAHRQVTAFNFASTAKAWYREAQKYIGMPLVLNEYQPTTRNNANLQALYDAEGYSRAATTNDLETHKTVVNSTFILVSTRAITGFESQAVISRMVTVDFEAIKRDSATKEGWQKIRSQGNLLSSFVPQCLNLNPEVILTSVKNNVLRYERESDVDSRIIENHVILQCFANAFLKSVDLSEKRVLSVSNELEKHQSTTNEANPAKLFLSTLAALAANDKVTKAIAAIVKPREQAIRKLIKKEAERCGELEDKCISRLESKGKQYLLFSLSNSYPFVIQALSRGDSAIPDEATLSRELRELGAVPLGQMRYLGTRDRRWGVDQDKYLYSGETVRQ